MENLAAGALDHISFAVSNVSRAGAFYDAALAPLGLVRVWSSRDAVGYGRPGSDDCFAIKEVVKGLPIQSDRTHLAFAVTTREAVMSFYEAAIACGAVDEGPAELCPEYGEDYFAAFVRDLDGYRIEAVCHSPP
jgi:catechol 2,3-dioxygenase-like lactoylglutathione lyase family enzyme